MKQKLRNRILERYWKMRLVGYSVANAKWVIHKHDRKWKFVVRNEEFVWDDSRPFDPHRLHLWTNEEVGRIYSVTIR